MSMLEKWRLIIDPPFPGSDNMATDEALLRAASSDSGSAPVLRIYGWEEPTLSLGYLQKSAPFVGLGLPVVRRITGGRALLHDDELTYAVVTGARSPLYAMGIAGCYSAISKAIVEALRDFGLDAAFARPLSPSAYRRHEACFASSARYEVLVAGKKIAGSAQRRVKGALLQHGSIMFGLKSGLWAEVFGNEALENTTTLMDAGQAVDRVRFRQVFIEKLSETLGVSFRLDGLTVFERELRQSLIEQRYSRREWNERAETEEPQSGSRASAGLAGI